MKCERQKLEKVPFHDARSARSFAVNAGKQSARAYRKREFIFGRCWKRSFGSPIADRMKRYATRDVFLAIGLTF